MTNTTKEQERAELHRTIWQIANDLRGRVDGWDFKQYVLGMLFYRFISENLSSYININEPKADFAFTMHMLSWLSTSGTAAIVEFPGVLYRGGTEQKIRKYLIDNNYIDAVIQLPPDLFFGTTIATCIIILKKSKTDNKTLFIDASAEFVRGGNKNKLSEENRTRILEAYTHREDSEYFAQLVSNQAIGENDCNIAVSSYVEQEDTREVVDITELNQEIAKIVSKQNELRISIDAIVADLEGSK